MDLLNDTNFVATDVFDDPEELDPLAGPLPPSVTGGAIQGGGCQGENEGGAFFDVLDIADGVVNNHYTELDYLPTDSQESDPDEDELTIEMAERAKTPIEDEDQSLRFFYLHLCKPASKAKLVLKAHVVSLLVKL